MWTKEEALSIKLLLSMLEIEPNTDKFNSWMLGASGATAALIVTNIESISRVTYSVVPKLLLCFLAVSALFGFLAKLSGIRARNAKLLFQHILAALNDSGDIDVAKSLEYYLSAFPTWLRTRIRTAAKQGESDPLHGFKSAANHVLMQGVYTIFQGLAFVAFIVAAALGTQ